MIEFIGWMATAFVGAYVVGAVVFVVSTTVSRGGLESIPAGLFLGGLSAITWLCLVAYWSPLTILVNT
jgi:hypothetical protein